jgi:hypothetical protein
LGILISSLWLRDSGFVAGDELDITTRVSENARFGEGNTLRLLVRVYQAQATLCLSDRSLHRFNQAIYILSG